MNITDNMPKWAATAVKWAAIGLAAGYVYNDISRDIDDFKRAVLAIDTRLAAINTILSPLDVDRSVIARHEIELRKLEIHGATTEKAAHDAAAHASMLERELNTRVVVLEANFQRALDAYRSLLSKAFDRPIVNHPVKPAQ